MSRVQRSDDHPSLVPLFDAVAEAPEDDGPRQVLSDALLERGDPRGEFISLQLLSAQGKATPKQQEREKILWQNHWRRWFSEVPGVGLSPTRVDPPVEFHRGFMRSCVFSPSGIGVNSPSWRMLERIDIASTGDARELAAPALQQLAVLTGLDAASMQVVLGGPDKPRINELSFSGPWMQADRGRHEQRQVLSLSRFTSLRKLRLAPSPFRHHADWLAWLFEAPLLQQLEYLTLWMELPFDVAGIHAQLVRQRLQRLRIELANTGVRLALSESHLTVTFDNEFWLRQRMQALRNLAPHFCPFPYRRFDVMVGTRSATGEELALLGEHFVTYAN
jgi:uncharacterized protein (TIGR02996 family)